MYPSPSLPTPLDDPTAALGTAPHHVEPIRIAQLDDHVAIREGLEVLIAAEPDLIFVRAAADEAELWPLLHARPRHS
jgi:hypothetical protein